MLQPKNYNHLLKLMQTELLSAGKKIGQIKAVTYWKLGRWIDLYLLHGKDRAKYGGKIYETLEAKSGIGARTLRRAVKFSQEFPILTAPSKLTWTHFNELDLISDPTTRNQLAQQAAKKKLTTRELKQEIKNKLAESKSIDVTHPPQLQAIKGELYTYVILEMKSAADPAKSVIDCGFGFDRTINLNDFPEAKFGKTMSFTYRAEVLQVIDADTLKVRIDLGLGGSFSRQKIRLKGIDAPEADTPEGKKAKAYVAKVLRGLSFIAISTSKSDKYDRYLADVWYGPDEKYLNQELLDLGLAKVWVL